MTDSPPSSEDRLLFDLSERETLLRLLRQSDQTLANTVALLPLLDMLQQEEQKLPGLGEVLSQLIGSLTGLMAFLEKSHIPIHDRLDRIESQLAALAQEGAELRDRMDRVMQVWDPD